MISTIVRNAMWLAGGEAAVKGGLLVAVMLLARAAGPSGVGTFSIAFAAAARLGVVALMHPSHLLRYLMHLHRMHRCPLGGGYVGLGLVQLPAL